MKILASLKSTFKLATVSSAILAATSLTNCGGGGGGSSDVTVRPKTLENVVLTVQGSNAQFEFIRSSGSTDASANGSTETGAFLFTSNINRASYQTIDSNIIDVVWPRSITSATYSYQAINDTQGDLTLSVGSATDHTRVAGPVGTFTADHSYLDGGTPSSVRMLISFINNGTASTAAIRMEDPDAATFGAAPGRTTTSTFTGTFTARASGGTAPLPLNYSLDVDFSTRVSRLSVASITASDLIFTDAIAANSFTLRPVSTGSSSTTETGQASYLEGPMGTTGVASADYTYSRIIGTDNSTLTLSNAALVSGAITGGAAATVNDTITLVFTSAEQTGVQQAAGTYTSTSGKSGTFTIAR